MIEVNAVSMSFPKPRRIRDFCLKPFKRAELHQVLENVSLRVGDGECVGLLGHNGAGKTTLLKLMAGVLYPRSGSIRIKGHCSQKENLRVRHWVGYVLNEERSFYWRLTGRQNLEFFGTLDNLKGCELRRRIDEVLFLVGLAESADRRVAHYSSGMRQRLAIARGLLSDPEVLLLDEPTRSLDPHARREILEFVAKELNGSLGKAIVVSTHRTDEVAKICHRVGVLHHRRIVAEMKLRHGGPCDNVDAFFDQATSPDTSRRG